MKRGNPLAFVSASRGIEGNETPEREQELKDLAFMLGKKYMQDTVIFVDSDGVAMYIVTREGSESGPLGSEDIVGEGLTLQDIEQFYTKIGKKKFKIKGISEEVENIYGSIRVRALSENWKNIYKKHGVNALKVWDDIQNRYKNRVRG